MVPFESLTFFYVLGIVLLLAAVCGLLGKGLKVFSLAANVLMILFIFNTPLKLLYLCSFCIFSLALVLIYQALRKKGKNAVVGAAFIILGILPLFISKLGGILPGGTFTFLGISYITFRLIQTIIILYDGIITGIDPLGFLYFLMFFPTIGSGPVDRYNRFLEDFTKKISKEEYAVMLKEGVWKLMSGVLYSFGFAALINTFFLSKMTGNSVLHIWGYMYAYTFFLFFNFAGYSNMAIGAGYILGIKVPVNFNMPFLAKDLKDFWSRWHISLSTWFRDYIYTRVAVLSVSKKWFKNVYMGSYLGYFIAFLTMGLWHGLTLRYIIYGLYYGVLMCLNDILDNKVKWFKKIKRKDKWALPLMLITFNLIAFGMLIFSGKVV